MYTRLKIWSRSDHGNDAQTEQASEDDDKDEVFAEEVWDALLTGEVPVRNSQNLPLLNMFILLASMTISASTDTFQYIFSSPVHKFLKHADKDRKKTLPMLKFFKAWEYSGTDSIWASIIDKLYIMMEKEFTPSTLT